MPGPLIPHTVRAAAGGSWTGIEPNP